MSTTNNHQSELFLWRRISSLMSEHSLNAKEIAAIAGVVPSAVAKWKQGGKIGYEKLERIADHFGESVDWLLGRVVTAPGIACASPAVAPPAASSPASAVHSATPSPAPSPAASHDPCHYPGSLPGEVAAIRDRLSALEAGQSALQTDIHALQTDMHALQGTLAQMAAQLQTVTALLSGALRDGIETRKAG
jgi:hypothetical protein